MPAPKNLILPYVKDFDKEAEAFLEHYGFGDAARNPQRIDIRAIAEQRMSIDVVDTEMLRYDGSIQGAIAFRSGVVEICDRWTLSPSGYSVDGPTIFIDSRISNIGRYNNTLAHECFHWYKHRNYFAQRNRLNSGSEFALLCTGSPLPTNPLDNQDSLNVMEFQANRAAPFILMPRKAFEAKVREIIDAFARANPGASSLQAIAAAISEAADFFGVSEQSCSIRMTEIGFPEASSFSERTMPIRIHNKSASSSVTNENQQPTSAASVFSLYQSNETFRDILDSGAFVYADGYIVLNDDRYIKDRTHLTEYALDHLSESTLNLRTRLVPDHLAHASGNTMLRSDSVFNEEICFDPNPQNADMQDKALAFRKKVERSQKSHLTSAQWLANRMESEKWNSAIFVERTGLDRMNYSRVRSGDHVFKLPALVAMGVGLGLDKDEMDEVMALSGLAFSPTDMIHLAYSFLFSAFCGQGLDRCNEFLEEVGVPTLGSKDREK